MSTHLCDVNVWLALVTSAHVHHPAAMAWLATIEAARSVVLVRPVQQAFLRLLTTRAFFAGYGLQPLTGRAAWDVFDALAADERVMLREDEPHGVGPWWRAHTTRDAASPKLWMDAWLAAFAVAGGYRFVTTDRAFRQFEGLDLLVLGDGDPDPDASVVTSTNPELSPRPPARDPHHR